MKHLGDISKINGADIEPVDLITFGSPCQDLSVAGKRAGLKHEANGDDQTTRSGLFMEAVRIIKEMREATNGKYPRFILWENVPGAFSSNKGEDFRIVLEEIIKIVEKNATMPEVPKMGWAYADSYIGDGWSLAYRTFDAQYWGVPQRRRRIYLIADFGGERAQEILFKREGLRGNITPCPAPGQGASTDAEGGVGAEGSKGKAFGVTAKGNGDAFISEERHTALSKGGGQAGQGYPTVLEPICKAPTLKASHYKFPPSVAMSAGFCTEHSAKARDVDFEEETAPTLRAGVTPAVVYDARGNGDGDKVATITGGHESSISDYTNVVLEPVVYDGANITSPVNAANPQPGDPCHTLSTDSRNYCVTSEPVYCLQGNGIDRADTAGCNGRGWKEDSSYTLNTIDRPAVAFKTYQKVTGTLMANSHPGSYTGQDAYSDMLIAGKESAAKYGVDCRNMNEYQEIYPTLQAKPNGGQSLNYSGAVRDNYIVRRLTPVECARLQGFPDGWGKVYPKEFMTPYELDFWQEVRNTHAAINCKQVKEYSEKQMLTWYNKLHTDSAEYKMWGNGIALPTALYCMEGIAEAINEGK